MTESYHLVPAVANGAIKERELKSFIESSLCYFEKITMEPADIGDAAIYIGGPPTLDYTGLIQVSGTCSGYVYVTLAQGMIRKMMESVGDMEGGDEACLDFVGEMANTISGNARKIFGTDFEISTPSPLHGALPGSPVDAHPCYVLPVLWRQASGYIVIALKVN